MSNLKKKENETITRISHEDGSLSLSMECCDNCLNASFFISREGDIYCTQCKEWMAGYSVWQNGGTSQ